MALTDITRDAVLQAIGEFERLGREAFLAEYGFGPARSYFLRHEGRSYDSKAIVGAAHGFLPGCSSLTRDEFSGGEQQTVKVLRRLAFDVTGEPPDGPDHCGVLLGRLEKLKVYQTGDGPALYQPLALLWNAGRARLEEERLLPWREVEEALKDILTRYGVRGERPRPDYPVAALHRAGLWELHGHSEPVPAAHGDSSLRQWFARNQPHGGLAEPEYHLLATSGEARLAVVDLLQARYFGNLDIAPVLDGLGLRDDALADSGAPPDAEPFPSFQAVATAAQYGRVSRRLEHLERDHPPARVTTVRDAPPAPAPRYWPAAPDAARTRAAPATRTNAPTTACRYSKSTTSGASPKAAATTQAR
jgi:5-methylcytosine-specific restriction protein A